MALTLIIGNKNYSSWSMRPWIAMKAAGIAFTEEVISLDAPDFKARVSQGLGHRQGAGAVRRRRPCLGVARDPRISRREISRRRPVAVRSGGAGPRPGGRLGDARRLRAAAPAPADEHVAAGQAARAAGRRRRQRPAHRADVDRLSHALRAGRAVSVRRASARRTPCTRRWCRAFTPMRSRSGRGARLYGGR